MEYRKFGNDYIVRIDRGEEILESLAKVCKAEHILLGTLNGLGAVGEVTLGVFNRDIFAYERLFSNNLKSFQEEGKKSKDSHLERRM